MPLQSQLVQVDFGQGVDTKTSPERLVPGQLRAGTNIRMNKDGAADKRLGSVYVGDSGSDCARLEAFRDEVLSISPTGEAFGFSSAMAQYQDGFVSKGQAGECVATRDHIYGEHGATPSVAYGNGIEVYVWVDADDRGWYMALDAVTGTRVIAPSPIGTLIFATVELHPRVVYLGFLNTFVIAYDDAAGNVSAITIAGDYSVTAAVAVFTNGMAASSFDMVANTAGDTYYIVYCTAAGNVTLYKEDTVGSSTLVLNAGATSAARAFSIDVTDDESVWVTYSYTAGGADYVKVSCVDEATFVARVGFPVTLQTAASLEVRSAGIVRHSATSAIAVICYGAAIGNVQCSVPVITIAGVVTHTVANTPLWWCQLASKPFAVAGKSYAWFYVGGARYTAPTPPEASQWSLILADLDTTGETFNFTARMACGPVAARVASPGAVAELGCPSAVLAGAGSEYVVVARILRSNGGRVGLIRVKADFNDPSLWRSAQLGDGLMMVPGTHYDSAGLVEMGFAHYPEHVVLTGGVGGSMAAGEYYYVVCYEWLDTLGSVHRSAPSYPVAVTVAASGSVTITAPSISFTTKIGYYSGTRSSVRLVVYRTTVGGLISGPFYQLTDVDTSPAITFTSQTTEYFDTAADTSSGFVLAQNAQLYTTGGVLDDMQPPCSSSMVTHKNRVWLASDDRKTVWFSKAYVEGGTVAFSDDFTVPLEDGARITALASMDSHLVIFTRNRIYALSGTEGPNDLGLGSDIGSPQRLSVDLGCIDQRSVVLMPNGLMFQSGAGIYLLSRGMEVSYIGQPIEDILALYPTITSAVVHPTNNCVYFVAQGATYGVRLVFDYRQMRWFWDEVGSATAAQGLKLAGECVSGSTIYSSTAGGVFVREATTGDAQAYMDEYVDGSATWVPMSLELADVHLAGVQGYQRAWNVSVLAKRRTDHNLTLSIANDNSDTFHQISQWFAPTLAGMKDELLQLRLSRQLCRSVRLKITDSSPTPTPLSTVGTGQGASLRGVSFEVAVESGPVRVKAGQRG